MLDYSIEGSLVSPETGATGVADSGATLVLNENAAFTVVLQAQGAPSGAYIATMPTVLPSGAPPASNGNHAVSLPALAPATTYAVGTLSDVNACFGHDYFVRFGSFTTQ